MDALSLTVRQLHLPGSVFVYQEATEAVSRCCTNVKSFGCDSALTGKYLRGQFTTVLTGHRALDIFEDCRGETSVIFELLRAVFDRDPRFFADKFVVRALVGILKAAPPAYVIDENYFEVRAS